MELMKRRYINPGQANKYVRSSWRDCTALRWTEAYLIVTQLHLAIVVFLSRSVNCESELLRVESVVRQLP